ncbi:MAG: hypothetical protein ACI9HK_005805 [Pirellulaceae bacterium]|jgi:hypothetical protein
MRNSTWLVLVAVIFLMGCGGSGDGPEGDGSGGTGGSNSGLKYDENAENNMKFELGDKTFLTTKVDPLAVGTAKLIAQRDYDLNDGELKSIEYRIVTEAAPEAAWATFADPAITVLGSDTGRSDYEADVTLAAGKADIQFRVDPGLSKRYEVSGWEVTVK